MRKQKIPSPSRLDRLPDADLISLVEAEMGIASLRFRGLSHNEIERGWTLAEMELHMATALEGVRAMQRRIALAQSI